MITTGQVAATTAAAELCSIPAGEGEVTITSPSSNTAGATVTAAGSANGVPIAPGDSIWFRTFPTQAATSLSVVAASGTVTVGFVVSSYNQQ